MSEIILRLCRKNNRINRILPPKGNQASLYPCKRGSKNPSHEVPLAALLLLVFTLKVVPVSAHNIHWSNRPVGIKKAADTEHNQQRNTLTGTAAAICNNPCDPSQAPPEVILVEIPSKRLKRRILSPEFARIYDWRAFSGNTTCNKRKNDNYRKQCHYRDGLTFQSTHKHSPNSKTQQGVHDREGY